MQLGDEPITHDLPEEDDNSDVGKAKAFIVQAHRAIFLSTSALLEDNLEPREETAFGKFADFFWFTKDGFQESTIQMQPKFISAALSHILGANGHLASAAQVAPLIRLFLPDIKDMHTAVLCKHSADWLCSLCKLVTYISKVDSGEKLNPEDVSDIESLLDSCCKISKLTPEVKLFSRVVMQPAFRKLQLFLQEGMTRSKTDEAVADGAKAMEEGCLLQVESILNGKCSVDRLSFSGLVKLCKTLQQLVEGTAQLPQDQESVHNALRTKCLSARDDLED